MFDYTLGLRSRSSLTDIDRIVSVFLEVDDLSRVHERHPGLFVSVRDSSDPHRQLVYTRFLGVPSTASLYYSINSRNKQEQWQAERLMALSAVLVIVQTDALAFMTFDLDSLVMRRTDGILYLYESFNHWKDPAVISQIPKPWVMTDDEYAGTPPGGSPYG